MQDHPDQPEQVNHNEAAQSEVQKPSPHASEHTDAAARQKKSKSRRGAMIAPPGYPWGLKKWLTREEIGYEYSICPRTIYNMEKRGLLVGSKTLRHRRYKRADVEACLEEGK